jgi:hypothetical protein
MTNHDNNGSRATIPMTTGAPRRQRASAGRRLTVRSDQRDTPDARKIALAILAITRRDDALEAGSDE